MTQVKNKIEKDLFSEMGLEDLSEDKKTELVQKWGEIIQKDVVIRLVQEMSEEDKKELDEMLAQNKEWEEIYEFLEKKFENLDDIVKEEVQKFQNELAESAKDLGFTQRE